METTHALASEGVAFFKGWVIEGSFWSTCMLATGTHAEKKKALAFPIGSASGPRMQITVGKKKKPSSGTSCHLIISKEWKLAGVQVALLPGQRPAEPYRKQTHCSVGHSQEKMETG